MARNQKLAWLSQGALNIVGTLHILPHHIEKFLTNFNLNKPTIAEDYIVKISTCL